MKNIYSNTYIGDKSNSGFTLLEVLVATAIITMIMAVAISSLAQFSTAADKLGGNFRKGLDFYISLNRLADLIESSNDYFVKNRTNRHALYFIGKPDEFSFVSFVGWKEGIEGSLNLIRLEEGGGLGSKEIVLYTRSLASSPFYTEEAANDTSNMERIVLWTGLQRSSFEYLGVPNSRFLFSENMSQNYQKDLEWKTSYNSRNTTYLPLKIKINIGYEETGSSSYIFTIRTFNFSKRSLFSEELT